MDWWSNWTGIVVSLYVLLSLSFSTLYIFSYLYLQYIIFIMLNLHYFGRGSLIRPLWSFDPIPEPTIYMMVNGEYAHCYYIIYVCQ